MYALAKREGYAHLFAPVESFVYANRQFNIMPFYEDNNLKATTIEELLSDDEREWIDAHLYDIYNSDNYVIVDGVPIIIDYACAPEFGS